MKLRSSLSYKCYGSPARSEILLENAIQISSDLLRHTRPRQGGGRMVSHGYRARYRLAACVKPPKRQLFKSLEGFLRNTDAQRQKEVQPHPLVIGHVLWIKP